MFLTDISPLVDSLLIFFFAFLIDLAFGELPDRIHPTVWMGKVIAYFKPKIRSESSRVEKINGVLLGLLVIMLFAVPAYFIFLCARQFLGWIPYITVSAVMLKLTFALKCMRRYTMPIGEAVKNGDYDKARQLLPHVVRRDPTKLNEHQIISAAVESIAESTADGVTSPFFTLFRSAFQGRLRSGLLARLIPWSDIRMKSTSISAGFRQVWTRLQIMFQPG